jgi:Zn-finger nucleic acid-binding protein
MPVDSTKRLCPRDGATLAKKTDTFVTLDVCPTCHGSLYERGEAETALTAGADVEQLVKSGLATMLERTGAACPACAGVMHGVRVVAYLHGSAADLQVPAEFRKTDATFEIDTCSACGALWLDAGEEQKLEQIGRESRSSLIAQRDASEGAPQGAKRGWALVKDLLGIKSTTERLRERS